MAVLTPITIEAEDLTLSANYETESSRRAADGIMPVTVSFASGNDLIRLRTTTDQGEVGTATGNFNAFGGETGLYTIAANIFDEGDGTSQGTLTIGATDLPSFQYDQNNLGSNGISEDNQRTVTFNSVTVGANDDIVFAGTREGDEVARLDSLVFTPIFTGALEFSVDNFSVNEAGGTAIITINRVGGMTGETRATINLSNGTADGNDYDATTQTVTFAEGETSQTIEIAITNDNIDEPNETVNLSLASIEGQSILGDRAQAVLTIVDDDETPQPPQPPVDPPTPPNPNTPTEGDDIITGTDAADVINALGGNDRVDAGDGDDTVNGGDGDDILNGEAGNDELIGGPGADTLNGGAGDDALRGSAGDDTLNGGGGADRLVGGGGNDTLNGQGGGDTLIGGGGSDTLNGGGGRDRLRGGGGRDILNGDAGRDVLIGNGGRDTLTGGGGSDTLTGGGGADTFVLEARAGVDRITDFSLGRDRLGLSDGLSFDDLTIQDSNGDALIRAGGNRLAILTGVDFTQLNESSFV